MKWLNSDYELPPEGVPVLICVSNTVQYITYTHTTFEDHTPWFEPYHFGADGDRDLMIPMTMVDKWAYIPERAEDTI